MPGPVLDEPRGAVGALHAVAAGSAQGERGVAAAVEEQHRLLAAFERGRDGGVEDGGEEASAFGRGVAEVDGLDGRQAGAAVAGGEGEAAVAAGFDVGEGLEAGGCGDEDGGGVGQAGADDRHVAGVVDDAVFLLEGGLVLLVDHDQAEIGEGQEQGGARADDDRGGALGRRRAR